jgi:hypothetical protein
MVRNLNKSHRFLHVIGRSLRDFMIVLLRAGLYSINLNPFIGPTTSGTLLYQIELRSKIPADLTVGQASSLATFGFRSSQWV